MSLLNKVPKEAEHLLNGHLSQFSGELLISRPRKTKLGDFRVGSSSSLPRITVNNDLNKYAFLVTLLHELAHYFTWKKWGRSVKPHGTEWKKEFQHLLIPYLNSHVFPLDIQQALVLYIKNPKASSCSDDRLYKSLDKHNLINEELSYISDLKTGGSFIYGNRGEFHVLEKKRKRYLCLHLKTKKKYLFQPITKVKILTPH